MRRLFANTFIAAIVFGSGIALLGLILFWVATPSVDASTTVQKTLSAGQSVVILPNGCSLSVISKSASQVKVKCVANGTSIRLGTATASTVTLNPGKKETVNANACTLSVVKQKKTKVKIVCNGATPTPTTPADATVHVAPSGQLKYSQASVTIHQGQTVKWIWDGGPHTVTSGTSTNDGTPDNNFCSPTDTNCSTTNSSGQGANYTHTFNTTGTFTYFCMVHGYSLMHAQVIVEP
jgi:plastocyanin